MFIYYNNVANVVLYVTSEDMKGNKIGMSEVDRAVLDNEYSYLKPQSESD